MMMYMATACFYSLLHWSFLQGNQTHKFEICVSVDTDVWVSIFLNGKKVFVRGILIYL